MKTEKEIRERIQELEFELFERESNNNLNLQVENNILNKIFVLEWVLK